MLGRPNWPEPVFMNSLAGAWLKSVAWQDFVIVMSSTIPAVCGKSSETQAPLWPWRANFRRVPRSFVPWLESMNAKRFPSTSESGTGWPLRSMRRGL